MRNVKKIILRLTLFLFTIVISAPLHADDTTLAVQRALNQRGFDVGALDGIWGRNTRAALETFYAENGHTFDGILDQDDFDIFGIGAPQNRENINPAQALTPAHNPQWLRYKDYIETPLRHLIVPQDFTLVDDWSALMRVHASRLTGEFDESYHFYGSRINFDLCVEDLSSTITTNSSKSGAEGVVPISAMCHSMLAQRFNNRPTRYVGHYRQILLNWLEQDTLKNANQIQARFLGRRNDYNYALQSNVSKMMGHYAVYHRLYDFEPTTHAAIVDMIETFAATYEYFPAYQGYGPYYTKLCDLRQATVIGGNDFCGSWNTRLAVGSTLFGLEFENQVIFNKGVQHIEVMLAMLDEQAMYTAQIGRGREGLSYADQINPAIDQLDYALGKAFGINFAEMPTVNGTTPGQVFKKLLEVANNPTLMLPYYNPDSDPTARYRGEFRDLVREIEAGGRPPQDVWEAFQERRYILSAPGLARLYHPDLFTHYWRIRNKFDYDFGNHITGFSPLTLREAVLISTRN